MEVRGYLKGDGNLSSRQRGADINIENRERGICGRQIRTCSGGGVCTCVCVCVCVKISRCSDFSLCVEWTCCD